MALQSTGPAVPPSATTSASQLATFAAGCFWGVELQFRKVPGVLDAAVGYMGGEVERPTYEQVCADRTGHAEVVQVEFDPAVVTYDELLNVFFQLHDPTTPNRQGPDVGSQYRSAVFVHSEDQRKHALSVITHLTEASVFSRPIVTEVTDAGTFWRAEEYHQRYLERHGMSGCAI